MGTNYYLINKETDEQLHIGKSSYGWCFSLHVIPEENINTLNDWKTLFYDHKYKILNEYDDIINVDDMLDIIENREYIEPSDELKQLFDSLGLNKMYKDTNDFMNKNHCTVDESSGLLRHNLSEYCIGNGEGTYDYITGDFS